MIRTTKESAWINGLDQLDDRENLAAFASHLLSCPESLRSTQLFAFSCGILSARMTAALENGKNSGLSLQQAADLIPVFTQLTEIAEQV